MTAQVSQGGENMAEPSGFVRQAGAIPVRGEQVCLITSSTGRRWIIPKGLIDPGHTSAEAALQEAWEEAGLAGVLEPQPLGSYLYDKGGRVYHVTVFLMRVTECRDAWPEQGLRQRTWVSAAEAVEMLEDQGLREIIRAALGTEAPERPAAAG